eukprot:GHRQ01024003.1.p1 GENE.GHRQ01024003.1~~GHRQ01024003.1.p1  ORF type:complete len:169 (+),score=50.36 GHRQ01024003.1:963-1469(+)
MQLRAHQHHIAGQRQSRLARRVIPAVAAAVPPSSSRNSSRHSRSSAGVSSGRQQQQHAQRRASQRYAPCSSPVAAHAAATASMDVEELVGPSALQPEVFEIITYALKLAWTAETYTVHSWMVLLGLLKKESYTACQVRTRVPEWGNKPFWSSGTVHLEGQHCSAYLQL